MQFLIMTISEKVQNNKDNKEKNTNKPVFLIKISF